MPKQEVFYISNISMECNLNKGGLWERCPWRLRGSCLDDCSLFVVYITFYCFSLHVHKQNKKNRPYKGMSTGKY